MSSFKVGEDGLMTGFLLLFDYQPDFADFDHNLPLNLLQVDLVT